MKLKLSQNWTTGEKLFGSQSIGSKELCQLVKSGKFGIVHDESLQGGLTVWIER